MSAAAALDAADGVIDGMHFGTPIIGAQPQFALAQPQYIVAQPAYGGYAAVAQPQFIGGVSSTAAALDAADGVMDGRHFGRPIVQAGATGYVQTAPQYVQAGPQFIGTPQVFGTTYATSATFVDGGFSTVSALDAADGVIDGCNFGLPVDSMAYGADTVAYGADYY